MLLGIHPQCSCVGGCLDSNDSALLNGLILIEGLGRVHSLSPFLLGEDRVPPFLALLPFAM